MSNFLELEAAVDAAVARRKNVTSILKAEEPEEQAVDPTQHLGLRGKTAELIVRGRKAGEGSQYDLPPKQFAVYLRRSFGASPRG